MKKSLILAGVVVMVLAFQNCGLDSPSLDSGSTSASSVANLRLDLSPSSVGVNQSAAVILEGGVPPVDVRVVSGPGIYSPGNLTASASGSVILEATDSSGQASQAILTVVGVVPTPTPTPTPTPIPVSQVFNVNNVTACINGYCSCHVANVGGPNKAEADAYCVYKGFMTSSAFSTSPGPLRQSQCHKPDGTNCFINASSTNLICTSITCVK